MSHIEEEIMIEATFFNIWHTDSKDRQTQLLEAMRAEASVLQAKPGFLGLSAWSGEAQDHRVVVQGRWDSKEAFDAAVTHDPAALDSRNKLAALGTPEAGMFSEAFRFQPAEPSSRDTIADLGDGISAYDLDVNGQTIHYLRAGTGPAVVLVHGYPESSLTWRKIMPELADKFTVIAPDTRGTGRSALADGFSLEDVADDVHELVRLLGFEKVCLVGQDFGVQVVSAYAAKHRNTVSALVVIESPLSGFGLEELFATFWHFGFLASPFAELLIAGKEKEFFSSFAFGDFIFRKESFPQADIDRYIADQARPGRLKAGLAYYRALLAGKDFFTKSVAPLWSFPILAIDGDHSMKGLTSKSFEKVATKLDSVIAVDCGHFVQEEQPLFLLKTLLDFLPTKS
jgi:pimeloyl-ACP methyl ester carboxylesterase/heme-degrading monooxygenase HmoA